MPQTLNQTHIPQSLDLQARTTAQWSALMLVYLLNKVHAHLIHSGTMVAGLFLESALDDPKWKALVHRLFLYVCVRE